MFEQAAVGIVRAGVDGVIFEVNGKLCEMVGRKHELAFGKHSGWHAVAHVAERHALKLSEPELRSVLEKSKLHAEAKRGSVSEAMVLEWIRSIVANPQRST